MLSLNDLAISYGQKALFADVSLHMLPNERYGIVGANGAGKSTLLRVIAGEESPNHGAVDLPKTARIGLLKQDQFRYEQDRIIDVVIQGNSELWSALQEKEAILAAETLTEQDGYRLGTLEETIAIQNGYAAATVAATILTGLGIKAENHDKPLSTLSGGFKLRVLLAQVLFQNPELLLLDEPTNHLDIITIAWLEQFLKTEFKGLLIFVSHDRGFLNNVATHCLDVDFGTVTRYVGNYERFLIQKQEMVSQKQQELQTKERRVAELQANVDRFRAGTRARQAQSKQKMIDKIELVELQDSSRRAPRFNFVPKKPSGKQVLKVNRISKTFDERTVLQDVSFTLMRGQKCALVGPNGIGKSTLLNILLQKLPANSGEFEWVESAEKSYYAQDYHDSLVENVSILNWLSQAVTTAPAGEVRGALGQVLISGKDADKNIKVLSGGEATRVILAKLMLEHGNVLILDEPTNHLDLESIEALAKALREYPGTILFVSHNRYFVNQVANRIVGITSQGVRDNLGDYEEYLRHFKDDYLAR